MKFLLLLILFTASSLGHAQWIYEDPISGVKLMYSYQLVAAEQDSSLNVNLRVFDDRQSDTLNVGDIVLNSENVLNKAYLSELLQSKYNSMNTLIGKEKLIEYSESFERMIHSIRDTISQRNEKSFVYQALRIYYKVFKASLRDMGDPVTFTVFGGFDMAICSFEVEEDLVFNLDDFKTYQNDRKLTDPDNSGINYYLDALSTETAVTLNMKQITAKLEQSFAGKWPQGGQCGCCGNYSGNCYFWSAACLAHDMACQRCQWDACFGGCVASSCSGNSISWYWYLL